MTFSKNTLKIGVSAALLALTTSASATTVTVPASATIDNAVDLTFTGNLSFGTIRASTGGTPADDDCVGLVLAADPAVTTLTSAAIGDISCATEAEATINAIDNAIARPEFTVTGVPAFQPLTLTLPTAATLTLPGNPPAAADFELENFTAFQTSGTAGAVGGTVTADVSGEITFVVGATIITDLDAASVALNNDYQDAAYEGTFDVTVVY